MIPPDRILIIDDDLDILELLGYNLRKEGYTVLCLDDPTLTIEYAAKFHPTLIILDAVMPALDGFSVCRQLRATPSFQDISIFMLTALVESQYENLAFGSGADDFVHKMLGLRSLTKRVELVLRKKFIIRKRFEYLEIGKWKIHRTATSVSFNGRTTTLSPEEFEVFYFLAQNANRSLTRDHIAQIISGANLFQLNFSIEKCLAGLTMKLGKQWIVSKGKNGFQFRAG